MIGGLDDVIDELIMTVESRFIYPKQAAEVGLEPLGGMTFVGPPGSGKTLLFRGMVDHLRRIAGSRVDFGDAPPGSWRSPWFGTSEHQIVEPIIRAERRLAEGQCDLVILFYDELDTLGTRSTDVTSRIDSRVLSALLHKIDGVAARREKRQILLVGATNRIDLIDEALIRPGRFGDQITYIPRPNRERARAIFRCHLSPAVRFWTNGEAAAPAEMVEKMRRHGGGPALCRGRAGRCIGRAGASRWRATADLAPPGRLGRPDRRHRAAGQAQGAAEGPCRPGRAHPR